VTLLFVEIMNGTRKTRRQHAEHERRMDISIKRKPICWFSNRTQNRAVVHVIWI